MFDFLNMIGNYEDRLVDNTKINGAVIDTVAVNDSSEPYETGIQHSTYYGGEWIIVEMYGSKDKAQEGHNKWVEVFESGLPDELKDVSTSEIAKLCDLVGADIRTPNKKQ